MGLILLCEICNTSSSVQDSAEAFDLGWHLEHKLKCPSCVEKEASLIALQINIRNDNASNLRHTQQNTLDRTGVIGT